MLNVLHISYKFIFPCTLIWIGLLVYGTYQGAVSSGILIIGDICTFNVNVGYSPFNLLNIYRFIWAKGGRGNG